MSELPFAPVPVDPGTPEQPPQSNLAAIAASTIELGLRTTPRSLQTTIGASSVGRNCARSLAYQQSNVPPCNFGDPMRLLIGTAVHRELEHLYHRIDAGSGRFLTEVPVSYRDVPGAADLVDRWLRTVIDWKTVGKARLATYQKNGIPPAYQVQIQIYAAGLAAQGIDVDTCAVVFLPFDGSLTSTWAWETKPDRSVADTAIDRLNSLRGREPASVPATPDRLCAWCAHYNPRTTDLNLGCPGSKGDRHE